MLVKVYALRESEIESILEDAEARSFEMTGSHDDSRLVISVDGQMRPVRQSDHTVTSIQFPESDSKKSDPGSLPLISQVNKASILETFAHYGSSQRSRATLRLFYRGVIASEKVFFVVDLGSLGGKDSGYAPFRGMSILEAVWSAVPSRIRVEAGRSELLHLALTKPGGSHFEGRNRFYDADCTGLRGNPQKFFELSFNELLEQITGVTRIAQATCDTQALDCAWKAVQAMFPGTALGRFLSEYCFEA